jgi:hypothetical protein
MGRHSSVKNLSNKEFLRMRKRELDLRLDASWETLKRSVEEGHLSEADAQDIFTHSRVAWTIYFAQLKTLGELDFAIKKNPLHRTHGKT